MPSDEIVIKSGARVIDGAGIDVRSEGGQVLAPGSIHPVTGKKYIVIHGSLSNIKPMPKWLMGVLTRH
jgi:hypothetical protein